MQILNIMTFLFRLTYLVRKPHKYMKLQKIRSVRQSGVKLQLGMESTGACGNVISLCMTYCRRWGQRRRKNGISLAVCLSFFLSFFLFFSLSVHLSIQCINVYDLNT